MNILTVDQHGKVVPIRAMAHEHADLLRACRGAGAGSFGLVTDFEFAHLPNAPRELAQASVLFSWEGMTPETFTEILTTFGRYFETRGQEPRHVGLYAVLDIPHSASRTFSLSAQFCNRDGACNVLEPLQEFLNLKA